MFVGVVMLPKSLTDEIHSFKVAKRVRFSTGAPPKSKFGFMIGTI